MIGRSLLCVAALGLAGAGLAQGIRGSAASVSWHKTVLDREFRAEGAAVADVNRDGRADILAGNLWYEAPDWRPHPIRPVQSFPAATGYSNAFLTFAGDVNRDGWPDELVVGFPGQAALWFQNPGAAGGDWTEHRITDSACNESPLFTDLNGDGRPELVSPHGESRMAFYELPARPGAGMRQRLVGEAGAPGCKRFSHGLGVADMNGDGRADILCNEGWYQAPDRKNDGRPWRYVAADLGPPCAQMYGEDFDGDGDSDVISSSAHAVGVWWHERLNDGPAPRFRRHIIDDSFSQSHSLMRADLNGDGRLDYVTGKRVWAHGPKGDIAPNHPAMLYWYEWDRRNGQVVWTRHEVDDDSGVGTGFAVADVNGDGRPDIVTANKRGVFLFTQR